MGARPGGHSPSGRTIDVGLAMGGHSPSGRTMRDS
jgi:hypothetical protein